MLSVDGVHCRIREPRPFSSLWSSHKFGGKSAVNYEIGLQIHKPKLAWVEGYTQPGFENDLGVFRRRLLPALAALGRGRKVIADSIYGAEPDYVSIKNAFDPPEIQNFKDRVASRHENFNGLLKNFDCLENRFRHGLHWQQICFRAVCCLVMFQFESGGYSLLDPYPLL